jgi:endogenous inhibitor of DNA gyrase (YacG/DUF329 family)
MARFCVGGCGKELKTKDGSTDYDKIFCGEVCRNKDKSQKLKDQRRKLREKSNCPTCGQKMPRKMT